MCVYVFISVYVCVCECVYNDLYLDAWDADTSMHGSDNARATVTCIFTLQNLQDAADSQSGTSDKGWNDNGCRRVITADSCWDIL